MDILNNPFISYDCIRSSVAATDKEKKEFCVEYGDILFQRSSETLEDVGHANVYLDNRPALFGGFTIRGKKKGDYNPLFFKHLLDSPTARKKVIVKGAGAQHFNIGQEGLSTVSLSFPSLPEQNKIATLFSLIDERIAIQNRVIERYESLIKALAFKVIDSRESNSRLLDCVICSSSTLKESELIDNGIPTYGASGISGYTVKAQCQSDSILITKDGSGVGTKQFVHGAHSFVGTLCSLTAKDGFFLPYIYYALINKNLDTYKTGQAIPHIYVKDYGKEQLFCPPYPEQIELARGLEFLDRKVSFERGIVSNLYKLKTSLLNQLFI